MKRSASISIDGKYRYSLTRIWNTTSHHPEIIVWIMLNPSTADAEKDDATIRRCISFSKREGAGGMTVMNLFAFRSAYPKVLWKEANDPHGDPVGVENDGYIYSIPYGTRIVAAWGTHGHRMFRTRVAEVMNLLSNSEVECLGTTAAGDPRHPVRLSGSTKFEIFKFAHSVV